MAKSRPIALSQNDRIEFASRGGVTPPLRSWVPCDSPMLEDTERKNIRHGISLEKSSDERCVGLVKAGGGHDRLDDSRTI